MWRNPTDTVSRCHPANDHQVSLYACMYDNDITITTFKLHRTPTLMHCTAVHAKSILQLHLDCGGLVAVCQYGCRSHSKRQMLHSRRYKDDCRRHIAGDTPGVRKMSLIMHSRSGSHKPLRNQTLPYMHLDIGTHQRLLCRRSLLQHTISHLFTPCRRYIFLEWMSSTGSCRAICI